MINEYYYTDNKSRTPSLRPLSVRKNLPLAIVRKSIIKLLPITCAVYYFIKIIKCYCKYLIGKQLILYSHRYSTNTTKMYLHYTERVSLVVPTNNLKKKKRSANNYGEIEF